MVHNLSCGFFYQEQVKFLKSGNFTMHQTKIPFFDSPGTVECNIFRGFGVPGPHQGSALDPLGSLHTPRPTAVLCNELRLLHIVSLAISGNKGTLILTFENY